MPIKIPNDLPAFQTLENENIFVIPDDRAAHQDIRALKIAIVNLMPDKIATETQLLRLLSNTPLHVDIDLIQMSSHMSKNTSLEHMLAFYKNFDEVCDNRYDGLIITGAPVEQMEYEDVDYWDELCRVFEWSKTNVFSTIHICWGAQAGLYYHYGVPKYPLKEKMFGNFKHHIDYPESIILKGFGDVFHCPHSRHTEVRRSQQSDPFSHTASQSPLKAVSDLLPAYFYESDPRFHSLQLYLTQAYSIRIPGASGIRFSIKTFEISHILFSDRPSAPEDQTVPILS